MQDIALALEITLNTGSQHIKIYENKMLEQKIDTKKKILKDEYKPTKEEDEFLKQKANKNNIKTSWWTSGLEV
ncbi:hypothetical protein [Campylobacter concisus]|uniref:hypothetical protein n=1 Tax=Campylobacter concisus TaxID=199 RepID=UPI00214D9C82|nr:hypothetical protein [Campylobacter concisus]